MRMLVTKVKEAKLFVDEKLISSIGLGYIVYLGIKDTDNETLIFKCVDKLQKLRIFHDEFDKMNLKLDKENHEILVVSQFTLYGDASNNNRPSFTKAAKPIVAKPLYELFLETLKLAGYRVSSGVFGAHMVIESTNLGPFNLIYEIGD